MLRPDAFQRPHIALGNLPYQVVTESSTPSLPEGGVLKTGRVVWTRELLTRARHRQALAFIEDIGTVLLDSRWLKTADLAEG